MTEQTERAAAIVAMLETAPPDPFDIWRAHHVTHEGDPKRYIRYQHLARKAANTRRAEAKGELW
jgi:hypothetical protein